MRSPEIRAEVLRLVGEGVNDCEVARRLGLPRTTVRDIRRAPDRPVCPRCWHALEAHRPHARGATPSCSACTSVTAASRAWGARSACGSRSTARTRASSARRTSCSRAGFPEHTCQRGPCRRRARRRSSASTRTHLPCLFPQHGPGKKHERPMRLEPWQWACVAAGAVGLPARAASAPTAARSSTGPGATSTSRTTSTTCRGDILDLFTAHLRSGRRRVPALRAQRAHLPAPERRAVRGQRRAASRDRSLESGPPADVAESGRRAAFRSPWANARGGSSPLIRIVALRGPAGSRSVARTASRAARRSRRAAPGGRSGSPGPSRTPRRRSCGRLVGGLDALADDRQLERVATSSRRRGRSPSSTRVSVASRRRTSGRA